MLAVVGRFTHRHDHTPEHRLHDDGVWLYAREVIDGQSIGVNGGLLLRWHGGRSTGGLF